MTKVVKKKLKLKKKNFTILLILIFTCLFIVTNGINVINKIITNKNTSSTKQTEKKKEINEKISHYNKNFKDRYIAYKKKNKNLSDEEIITRVNIGLDNEYYTNTKPSTNLNKNTILVNKYNYLEENYIPNDLEDISLQYARSGMKLVREAKEAYEAMAKNASTSNLKLVATSSYRSYEYQDKLYNNYIKSDGIEAADTYSGRPGFSEHQTGLAVDIYNGKETYTNFEKTKEFEWMQKNAYKYGFILRFPKDKEDITGYIYESWHYRYVGIKIATYIHENNISYEEYYVKFIEPKK